MINETEYVHTYYTLSGPRTYVAKHRKGSHSGKKGRPAKSVVELFGESAVQDVINRHNAGEPIRVIVSETGISIWYVSKILCGK